MRHLKKILEYSKSILGWDKSTVRNELYGNCDEYISKIEKKLEKTKSKLEEAKKLKDNLDSDLNDLDFSIRANFSDQPGFSHYSFDIPGHSNLRVKCSLEIVFKTNELSFEKLQLIVNDFSTDCKHLISINVFDTNIIDGKNWGTRKGYRVKAYLSTITDRVDEEDEYDESDEEGE